MRRKADTLEDYLKDVSIRKVKSGRTSRINNQEDEVRIISILASWFILMLSSVNRSPQNSIEILTKKSMKMETRRRKMQYLEKKLNFHSTFKPLNLEINLKMTFYLAITTIPLLSSTDLGEVLSSSTCVSIIKFWHFL